jgi:pre-rRNA-processing protein TSR1
MKREERKQQMNDIRKNKREEALNKKRNIGGATAPPFLTTIIVLNECIDPNSALAILEACDSEAFLDKSNKNLIRLRLVQSAS